MAAATKTLAGRPPARPRGPTRETPRPGSPCRERRPEARLRDRPGDDLLGDRLRRRARQAGDRPQPGERADHPVGRPVRRRQHHRRQHRQGVGEGRAAPGRLAGQAAHGRPQLRLRVRGAGLRPRGHQLVRPPQGRRRRRGRARRRDDHRRRDHLPGLLRHRRARGDGQRRAARRAERPRHPQRADRRGDRLRAGAGGGPGRAGLRPRRRHLRHHDDRDQGPPDPRHLHRRRPPPRRRPVGRGDRDAPGRAVPRADRLGVRPDGRPRGAQRPVPPGRARQEDAHPARQGPLPRHARRPAGARRARTAPRSRRSPATCSTARSS